MPKEWIYGDPVQGGVMRFIPTHVHGPADYVMGVLLIVSPWLFGFAEAAPVAVWIPIVLGAGVILYSLLTEYEWGLARVLPMSAHLVLDGLGGLVLLISPWLLGFAEQVWVPHAVLGLLEIGAALFTETSPRRRRLRVVERG